MRALAWIIVAVWIIGPPLLIGWIGFLWLGWSMALGLLLIYGGVVLLLVHRAVRR